MKSIIAAVVTCVILFGASFAASKYYMDTEPVAEGDPVNAKEESIDQTSTLPPNDSEINKIYSMPVAHRPDKAVSLEAVLQMSDNIKKLEGKLILRQEKLDLEEQRVQMLFRDVEEEQGQLQAFSEGVDAKVKSLARLKGELQQLLSSIDTKQVELASMEKDAGVDEESKLTELDDKANDVKSWFEKLEAQQASDVLKEFANNGKMDFAASILHKMSERQKTKILTALDDPTLVDQLITALRVKPKTQ